MKTFIKVVEIWVPAQNRSKLELSDGLYGDLFSFRAATEQQQFGFGEGMPGMAWAERRSIMLKDFANEDGRNFRRAKAAQESGLSVAVAVPVFAGEILLAVVMFFCGDDEEHAGAIEIWSRNPELNVMGFEAGYYGTLEKFEWLSQRIQFPSGSGLPGTVWQSRMPMVIEDLGCSATFLRAKNAAKEGITTALGIPCLLESDNVHVITFLSAKRTPISRRFEIWVPDGEKGGLVYQSGHCDFSKALKDIYKNVVIPRGEGVLGRVWLTGVPQITQVLEMAELATEDTAVSATSNFVSLLAMPVFDEGLVRAIVVFYFSQKQ